MLGVISTHEPIRGEFAKSVREMLKKSADTKCTTTSEQTSKWVVKDNF